VPYRVDSQGLLTAAFPFFLSQLLLLPWLCGRSRSALMPELYRWVFVLPLAASVVMTLLGRPQGFQVTPKSMPTAAKVGPSKRLLFPLLMLLGIQLLSQVNLTLHHGSFSGPAAGGALQVTLIWGWINSLLLLAAIRICWDRKRLDTTPWFTLQLAASLSQPGLSGRGQGQKSAVQIHSISEGGCEVDLRHPAPWELANAGAQLELLVPTGGLAGAWPVQLVRTQACPGGLGIGLAWGALDHRQREQLQGFLYRRANLWPHRRAPFDGWALLALGRRMLQRPGPDDWFQRSQLPVSGEAAAGP